MIVGSILEDKNLESRVAITPDIVKKYNSIGLEVHICERYATHLGISDDEYKKEGAKILSANEILSNSNAILQMNMPSDENLKKLKKNQILIGVLNAYLNKKK